jgi:hypothetical protein
VITNHIDRQGRHAANEPLLSAWLAALAFPVLLALVFLAFHLPYLPASLEDLDSINFALGLRRFDVAEHQPHPPGYPLFILAAKAMNALVGTEAGALAAVSIVSGALGVLAIAALFRALDGLRIIPGDRSAAWPIAATAVAVTCPLYWFTAARPLSDVAGLAAALAVQAAMLGATTNRALVVASACAALAVGIRSQVVWLTLPLLLLVVIWPDLAIRRRATQGFGERSRAWAGVALAYVAGALVWAVPLVVLSGGPAAYLRAFFSQGAEDLSGIQMLWTTPNIRTLLDALYYSLIAPWALWWIAAVVLVCALAGAAALVRRQPAALVVLAAAFGPYFVFDLLFQETFTGRYALPLVIPVAFLAVTGARLLPKPVGLSLAALLAMYCAHIGGTSVAAFAAQPAPVFRLLDDMPAAARAAGSTGAAPVLAMDRREEFDLRRPIRWMGDAIRMETTFERRLLSPPQHEWLEMVKYWNGGGRSPVWFVADPLRTDIDLVQHPAPVTYRWAVPYPVLLSGVRPNEMDWHRLARPEWYVGHGWALTPEAAGVSENDRRGAASGDDAARDAWIAREVQGGAIVIGGRSFDASAQPTIAMTLDGAPLAQWTVAPGFFLRFVSLPPAAGGNAGDYAKLTIRVTPPSRVAMEQFDASAVRPLVGFGDGWNEPEYNPRTGRRWRWLSEKGELKLRSPVRAVQLHLEGESPLTYFSRGSRLVVRAGQQVAFDQVLSSDFSLDIGIPDVGDTITLETDQIFVPADRSRPWRRSGDLRHLGLRIFKCELR